MMTFFEKTKQYRDPEVLADAYLKEYFKTNKPVYPLNPFQMLRDSGIVFALKRFSKLEGIYIPASSENDTAIVGINFNRPIVRQRFTAAHELCHHLRDADKHIACPIGQKDAGEYFADKFAAAVLMPLSELRKQTTPRKNPTTGYITFDDALEIADYFGVSFESCVYRLAYKLHAIDGDIDPDELKKRISRYKPDKKRQEKGMYSLKLYEGLVNSYADVLAFQPTDHARLVFQTNYIYNDSRMEGIQTTPEAAAEIVTDLRLKAQNSQYCIEDNEAFLSIAGHFAMYQEILSSPVKETCSVFELLGLHKKLFSFFPHPEYGGSFRQSNSVVREAKCEVVEYQQIPTVLIGVEAELKDLLFRRQTLTLSEYIEGVIIIHHKLTVIHPFGDGNGRTLRAFLNVLLVRSKISPVYIKTDEKEEYINALSIADTQDSYIPLFECLFKCILRSSIDLSDS